MLKDKTIVVTGATGGLGKALVSRLAGMGADVVALGRNEARLQEVRRSVNQGIRIEVVDLGERSSVRAAADRLLAGVPRIDALVHTAAVYRNELLGNPEPVSLPLLAGQLGNGTLHRSANAPLATDL